MTLSENMKRLLLLARRNGNRPTLQSTALHEIFGLSPRTRLRQRPGRFFSPQQLGNGYHAARSSLTRSLRRLEQAELIERKRARSTGGAAYTLTHEGRELAEQLQGKR